MTPHNKQLTYQETFLEEMFERLHHHKVSQKDYTGLADMLNPIEALADSAATSASADRGHLRHEALTLSDGPFLRGGGGFHRWCFLLHIW